jgi:hypothetical protein
MARVEDAREAEEIVWSYFGKNVLGPKPYDLRVRKQGYTWIVTYSYGIMDEKGEMRVNAKTGKVTKIK